METYLTKNGEVRRLTFKEIGTTWRKMNENYTNYATKEETEFLRHFGLEPTIFNISNLREYGVVHLTKHFVEVVLKNGAVDKR